MKKTKPKKLLTVLLALCMVLSLVPLSVFAATPATETADFTVGQGREAITLLNQYKTGTAESLWDNTAKTLTLWGVDFTTTAQTAVKLPAGATIVLKDGTHNTIQSGDVSLEVSGGYSNATYINALDAAGSLTIEGGTAGSGTLSVFAGKLKNSGDGWVYSSGISVDGDFTVKGGRVTARGGCAESDGSCFSFGVKMDSDTKNKALLVTGGTLTAIADEAYELEEGGTKRASFSRGVEMFRGNVIVSGSGKLRAESVEAMAEATVMSNGLYISAGNLTVANSAEVAVAGAYAAYISGGSLRLDGGSLTAVSTQTADDNGNLGCAIDMDMDLNKQVADSGSITVSGGTLETVNGDIRMSTIGATGNQSLFTVTGGTIVNRGQLYGPKKLDISGGTMQTQGIEAEALTLSDGSLTIREPVRKNPNYDNLLVRPALGVKTLTVSGGTLDAAWDWGQFTPIVFPVNTYYGYTDSLVEMTGSSSVATFTGGTTTLDTGKAGNTALLIKGQLTIGDGMAETGADSSHRQLGTAPVKIAAAAASTAITTVDVANVKLDYQPGDAPQATAEVYNDDADKYEIAYECWQEFENNEPVAAWYSDNGSHGSLPTITEFESGKKYVYSLMLKPKNGYSFSNETAVTVNGESVKSSLSGEYLYVPAVKTITPTKQNSTLTAIDVENVKLDYQPGDAPQASAKKAGTNQDKYDILFECWEKNEKDANDSMHTVGYWYSDESCYSDGDVRFSTFEKGGRYKYSVKLQAKDGYTFDSNLTNKENVTLNGASLPSFGSWVMVMDDGKTCLIVYGTELRPGQAVEEIDFGARINFIEGDKPYFLNSAVDPFIDLDHERWDANDGSGYGITSSDFWNERYNGKLITEFEAGKSYTYGVYFKISDLGMEEGYRFDKNTKLYINGEEITLTPDQISIDDSGETIWFMNVLTMTPTTVKVIDVVEINDATVSFKDGDKPVFTGKSPEGVKYAYNCEWWELDSKTGAISADFFSGAYENKITAFEAGKTYHYGVYVKAVGYVESENTTYVFGPNTKLKINGEFVNYKRYEGDTSDGSDSTMWVLTDLTMTPATDGHTHKYGTEWKYDETNHWHECECGNKADITAHNFKWIVDRKATTTEKGSKHEECTVCGYKKTAVDIPKIDSHNHNYGTEWKYDETNHWHECEDGNKADITAHTFKQIIDKKATATEKGSKHEECTVCGYKKTAVDIPATDFRNSSDDQPNKPIKTASSESSSADQTNKPINTDSPKTGNTDYMILWIVLLIAGGGVFITATAVDRKKK
nr:hypothetical protein [uncultured Ruminococcus sp.]